MSISRNQAAVGGRGRDPRGEAVPRVAGGQSVPHGAIPWQVRNRKKINPTKLSIIITILGLSLYLSHLLIRS